MNALTSGDFVEAEEPFDLFRSWFAEAEKSEINDPNAMALATADADGVSQPTPTACQTSEWFC